MGTFKDLGSRLDRFAEHVWSGTSSGIERTRSETKEWGKVLDELADRMRKTAQEGMDRIAKETRDLGHAARVRAELRDKKKLRDQKLLQLGRLVVSGETLPANDEERFQALRGEIIALDVEIDRLTQELEKSPEASSAPGSE